MDRIRTKEFYDSLPPDYVCGCSDCRSFVLRVKEAYPLAASYLAEMGADIEKPFESWSVDVGDGMNLYPGVQYIIIGSPDGFREADISGVHFRITDSHPVTDIDEEHFVIEGGLFYLKMDG